MSLKNISSEPVVMMWNGQTTVLLPGKTCRFIAEPAVELRMKGKYPTQLQYTPEPVVKDRAANVLIEDDAPTTSPEPETPPAESKAEKPKRAKATS